MTSRWTTNIVIFLAAHTLAIAISHFQMSFFGYIYSWEDSVGSFCAFILFERFILDEEVSTLTEHFPFTAATLHQILWYAETEKIFAADFSYLVEGVFKVILS
ncbi:hypothetical protein CDAR_211371 [Caerostris darwini]|uniref:Uncharacterized protein n=1 Tax=Caerostris darwini TaxID=1538125 RepID=A0AAV4W1P0_9ARAC|nr:hypothetical protein CDAR_211371 [Caerostris darwini]